MTNQTAHTPGPWRWEFNRKHKALNLVGGRPMYDLTIMDFDRWGMGGAVATLRDLAHDGMNIMHRLPDRPDWIKPFTERPHHADWCSDVVHPDMRLMAAAPDLLVALQTAEMAMLGYTHRNEVINKALKDTRAAITKATGETK